MIITSVFSYIANDYNTLSAKDFSIFLYPRPSLFKYEHKNRALPNGKALFINTL